MLQSSVFPCPHTDRFSLNEEEWVWGFCSESFALKSCELIEAGADFSACCCGCARARLCASARRRSACGNSSKAFQRTSREHTKLSSLPVVILEVGSYEHLVFKFLPLKTHPKLACSTYNFLFVGCVPGLCFWAIPGS